MTIGVRTPLAGVLLDETGAGACRARAAASAAAESDAPPDNRVVGVPPSEQQQRVLRRSVLVEAAVVALILALSAVLVGTPPAKSAVAQPVDVTLPLTTSSGATGLGQVQLSIDPAATGTNTLHLYLFDEANQLTQAQDLRVSLTASAQEIGPLPVDLQPAGPGHSISEDMSIPTKGTWTLTVTVRLDEFTATTTGTDFQVR